MGLRYGQGVYGTFKYGPSPVGFTFKVQIANSSGTLQAYVNNEIAALEFSYTDQGGCEKLKMFLRRQYDNLTGLTVSSKKEKFDIKVYIVPDFGDSAVLFWRGEIANIQPALRDSEEVQVLAYGYVNRLKKLQVHDEGAPVEFASTTIGDIVDDIITDYVVTPAGITKGTIDTFSTVVSSMKFNGSVYEAIEKLAKIVNAEWGVDASREFFFRERSILRGHRFREGYDISEIQDEIDYDQIVNAVIVEGGEVNDVPVRVVVTRSSPYETSEKRINNAAVLSQTVGERLGEAYLDRYGDFLRNTRIVLPRNKTFIEETVPMKRAIIDRDPRPNVWHYGTLKYGTQKYASEEEYIIRRIIYQLNDTSLTTEIEFGEGKPDVKDRFEELQFKLEQQRQTAGV